MKKIFLLFLLLLVVACSKPDVPVEQPVSQPVAPEPVAPVVSEPVAPVVLEPGEPIADASALLSGLRCVGEQINAEITNVGDVPATLGRDLKILVNGLIVVDPECDKLTLQPGEKTVCTDLSGHYRVREGQANRIKINLLRESIEDSVICE